MKILPNVVAPIPFEILMLAKTSGAILFGVANAFVPVVMAAFLTDLSQVVWWTFVPAVFLIAVASTFLGLSIDMAILGVFCIGLFMVSLHNIRKRWIV